MRDLNLIFPAGGSTKSGYENPELEQDEGIGGDQGNGQGPWGHQHQGDRQGYGGHQHHGDGQGQRAEDRWLGERQETAGSLYCFSFDQTGTDCSLLIDFRLQLKFHFLKNNLSFALGQILPNLGVEKLSTLDLM